MEFFVKRIHFFTILTKKTLSEGSFRFLVQECLKCENHASGQGWPMGLQKQHMLLLWVPLCCWVPQKLFKKYIFPLRTQIWSKIRSRIKFTILQLFSEKSAFLAYFCYQKIGKNPKNQNFLKLVWDIISKICLTVFKKMIKTSSF